MSMYNITLDDKNIVVICNNYGHMLDVNKTPLKYDMS